MRKQLTILAAIAAGLASIIWQTPMAHAQPSDTLVPDDVLAACFASAIGSATGITPNWQSDGITQGDIDAWAGAGGVDSGGFACSGVNDLTGIDKLPYTQTSDPSLYIGGGAVTDLSPLAGLTNLKSLDLSNNNIANLAPLAGLTSITTLFLNNNRISDLSPLAKMSQMDGLYLDNNRISDVTPLAGMTKLSLLSMESNNVTAVSPLAWMPTVHYLYVDGNPITDANALATMTNLEYLGVSHTGISDISWLADLTNLTYLDLQNNAISDIAPLAKLTKLYYLYANDNQISDISALAGLTKLSTLTLNGNPLGDLSPLVGLKRVTYLQLADTGISDLGPLAAMPAIANGQGMDIFVSGNHITDISPLKPCTQAQGDIGDATSCTVVYAQIQTLEQSALVGVPQALPEVIGQPDDPVQWTITQGSPQPVISGDQVTFSAPGTYVLQFQDQPAADQESGSWWFDATKDFCEKQNGTWYASDNQCSIEGEFTGMVTYTVSVEGETLPTPSDTPSGEDNSASPSGISPLVGGLVAGGVVLVAGMAAVLIWWRKRGMHAS